ncbi:MAG: YggT family protein [Deltaproteobacteria bacterium]|nr:YggT family protein [Deltaproteobacteria bacterium]
MFVFANLLNAIAQILDWGANIYVWVIIARSLISWVNPDPYNPIVRFLYQATEPLLYRIRRFIPFLGGLDISPIIAIFAIYFFKWFIVKSLMDIAIRLKMGAAI